MTPSLSQSLMIGIAVIGLVVVAASIARRRRPRRTTGWNRGPSYSEPERGKAAIRDMEEVMVELEELARRVHGRLDLKLATLETLIRDADQRIEQLSRADRQQVSPPTIDVTLAQESPELAEPPMHDRISDPLHSNVYRLSDGGLSAIEIAHEVGRACGEIELILALRRTRAEAAKMAAV